jgi:hypothetical protein
MKNFFSYLIAFTIFLSSCGDKENDYDIIVYGGTSAGVIAARAADLEGKRVLLIEPGAHLGGLTSGGLGQTDIGNKHAVTGLSRDFYRRLGDHYGKLEAWKFEPHVAENIYNDIIEESNIEVLFDHRITGVEMQRKKIRNIKLEKTSDPSAPEKSYSAEFFIDCSYEGDLMAHSGVSYTVGRESNDTYGETYNGVQLLEGHQFPDNIDPYLIPGDPSSGLCRGIQDRELESRGTGDHLVQAYNYRLCLTQDTTNMVRFTAPPDYDPAKYELLKRVIQQRDSLGWKQDLGQLYLIISPMPNGKTDINNKGPMSTDAIGMNWDYPEADYDTRDSIALEVENYIKGLLYFFANDPGVTKELRTQMNSWGWSADEFQDNDHFPHQMYVREARRLIGEYVMTEHNCMGDSTVEDGIGLAAYTMDSHNCQRIVVNGMVKNEGNVEIGDFPPYEISYRSLVPKREECTNLSVPVCMSSSHIAFGSIRMEPVFMVLGQVCGLASSMAIDNKQKIQEINVNNLVKKLEKDPLQDGSRPDIIVDNSDTQFLTVEGDWEIKSTWMGQNKSDHLFWKPGNDQSFVSFTPPLPEKGGRYSAYLYVPRKRWSGEDFPQFADDVKVEVKANDKLSVGRYNFEKYNYDWVPLGSYEFMQGDYVRIYAGENPFPVTADALLLVPEE